MHRYNPKTDCKSVRINNNQLEQIVLRAISMQCRLLDAKVGDTVTIFGDDPTVSELAEILGTIPYEIMTSIPRRIDREIIR